MHIRDAHGENRLATQNYELEVRTLRMNYLLGHLSEERCNNEVQLAETSMLRSQERMLLAQMLHETVATIIDNFCTTLDQFDAAVKAVSSHNDANPMEQWKWFPAFDLSVLLELERLRLYYNREACCISRTYASTEHYITVTFEAMSHKF